MDARFRETPAAFVIMAANTAQSDRDSPCIRDVISAIDADSFGDLPRAFMKPSAMLGLSCLENPRFLDITSVRLAA